MNPLTRNILIGGLAVALIIGILSPFIASQNPDGLTATAEHLNPKVLIGPDYWHAPFDNYLVHQLGNGPLAGIAALMIGVFLVFGLVLGVTEIIKRKKHNNPKIINSKK